MIRHCDGSDPFLTMATHPKTGDRLSEPVDGEVLKPCDCGALFDDVTTLVIYPHRKVRP